MKPAGEEVCVKTQLSNYLKYAHSISLKFWKRWSLFNNYHPYDAIWQDSHVHKIFKSFSEGTKKGITTWRRILNASMPRRKKQS